MSAVASELHEVAEFQKIAERRRSVYGFLPTPVPHGIINWAIRMATLAPNHYKTRPWRFHVFDGPGRERLADAFESGARSLGQDPERARGKIYPAPTTIVVTCLCSPDHPKALLLEDQFATAAAVENMLLAFASAGIGTMWGTGRLIETDAVRAVAGLSDPRDRIIGSITVGYADPERPLPDRADEDPGRVTRWYGG